MNLLGNILAALIVLWATALAFDWLPIDSTDKSVDQRSGMKLHIDNMTGCHYLSQGFFGGILIKRVDEEGKHICSGE